MAKGLENRAALIALRPAAISLPEDEWESALAYLRAALSPGTQDAYIRAFSIFADWCDGRALIALPAAPETVASFFAFEADRGVSPSRIGVLSAAIAAAHEAAGFDSPTKTMIARRVQSGIRRTRGGDAARKKALVAQDLKKVVQAIADWRYKDKTSQERVPSLKGLRDRALLLLGFCLAARRSELAALTVTDIEIVEDGLIVTFRKSKGDQDRKGQQVAVLRGKTLCPVEALSAWLKAACIVDGPLFRPVSKADRVLDRSIEGRQIARIYKARCAAVGIDAAEISGHSLRSGFLTTAAMRRANIWKMAEVSRHKDIKLLRTYVRKTELFEQHAGRGIL